MGNIFSGWYGKRNPRPYFDELLRITIADCKQHPPGQLLLSWQGGHATVRKILAPAGFLANAPRLQCARCRRACKLIYVRDGVACCNTCAGARYRTQAESPARRAYRAAMKALRRWKFDTSRPGGKPKWQRWPTFERREDEALAAMPAIDHIEGAPYALLERIERKRGKRGRPNLKEKS